MLRYSFITSLALVSLILLIGCGGGGSASAEQQQEEDFAITLIPEQNGTKVEWVIPSHFNITGVRILLEGHSPNGTIERQFDCLVSGSGYCTISNLSSDFVYSLTISLIHQDGSSWQIGQQELEVGANYDEDGIIDRLDKDDDNDGVIDERDSCPQGETGWLSNRSTDYDRDGCQDRSEDLDDDNDLIEDLADLCQYSLLGLTSNDDSDGDGCRDRDEDAYLAGVSNLIAIPMNRKVWLRWINPNASLAYIEIVGLDGDEIRYIPPFESFNLTRLNDHTNYTFSITPQYANGGTGNTSVISVRLGPNYDLDQLADIYDADDDNDGVLDNSDQCPVGETGWTSNGASDHDGDGCRDGGEDTDDDNDGLADSGDSCRLSPLGFHYLSVEDMDRDGCRDQDEDSSLAGATGLTAIPSANQVFLQWRNPRAPVGLSYRLKIIWSYGGLEQTRESRAAGEDRGDIILDGLNNNYNYTFTVVVEYDNGILGANASIQVLVAPNHDSDSQADPLDTDDDNDGLMDDVDNCPQGAIGWLRTNENDYDDDGCRNDEDPDYDNDGLTDKQDNCPFSPLGLDYLSDEDSDHDGCRDRDEDDFFPGVSGMSALPNSQTIHLSWINPNGSLANISVQWNSPAGSGLRIKQDQLAPLEPAFMIINGLVDHTNYSIQIIPHYRSEVEGNKSSIRVLVAPNYDNDSQADSLDGDDDNDGLADEEDNCPFSPLGFDYLSDQQDGDHDGCRDRDEDDFLPGVSGISALPNSQTIRLSWINPNGSLANISVQWDSPAGSGIRIKQDQLVPLEPAVMIINGLKDHTHYNIQITPHYRSEVEGNKSSIRVLVAPNYDNDSQVDSLDNDDDNDGVMDSSDDCVRGEVGWQSSLLTDHDGDGCRDRDEDQDDDNDGVLDIVDSCPQGAIGWLRTNENDYDGDGCRDRDEDTSLPGISNLTVVPMATELQLDWKNPSFPLDYVNISWGVGIEANGFITGTTDEIRTSSESHVLPIYSLNEHTLTITPHYANGGKGEASVVKVQPGINYDGDLLIDALDEDDDNDGLPDTIDLCDNSPLGFRFGSSDDIDKDGCHDLEEDNSLPAISNLSSFSYEDQIDLSWTNPDQPLTNLSIHWAANRGTLWLDANTTSVNIDGLQINRNYNFTIFTHFAGGLIGEPRSIEAPTGTDYDGDGQIDYLDEDDDNDDIPDSIDECDTSPLGYQDLPIEQDINGDGCQDRDNPDPLGLTNLTFIVSDGAVQFQWTNPYASYIAFIDVEWTFGVSKDGILLDSLDKSTNLTIDSLINGGYQFRFTTIYPNGARSLYSINIVVGPDYDKDSQADLLDGDDDNDGLADELDNCPFSPLGFNYLSDQQDSDHDGCRDRDEDDFLPGVSGISALPNSQTIRLSWINPNGSLANISVQWNSPAGSGIRINQDQLVPLEPAVMIINDLVDYANYSVQIIPNYRSGVEGNAGFIQVLVAPNHDNDSQADPLDSDDDNDGLMDIVDSCPQGEIGWLRTNENDYDGDGCRNDEDQDDDNDGVMDMQDVDDDGDGLIEIESAESLFNIRYQLDGSGYRSSASAAINKQGCGTQQLIDDCFGYELTGDISLAAYPNWLPLANDLNPYQAGFQGSAFNATFDGNGYEISELTIRRSLADYQALFGRLAGARVSRLGIRSIRIAGADATASLAGEAINSIISDSVVKQASIRGREEVGSLVGRGRSTTILSSSSINNDLVGFSQTSGGLIGGGNQLTIRGSSNINGTVFSHRQAGGLIGGGSNIYIDSSALIGARISGSRQAIGGLVGQATNISIHNSSNYNSLVLTSQGLAGGLAGTGGLIGLGDEVIINASSLELASIYGGPATGGLIGEGKNTAIFFSLIDTATIHGSDQTGGLIGKAQAVFIVSTVVRQIAVHGNNGVGGLVGDVNTNEGNSWTFSTFSQVLPAGVANFIYASVVMDGKITGSTKIGGMVGVINRGVVLASYGEELDISGSEKIGGLVGDSSGSSLLSSYIAASRLSQADCAGGLIGSSSATKVFSSYAAVFQAGGRQNNACHRDEAVFDSYIDRQLASDLTQLGSLQPTAALQQPTNYTGIYANWDEGVDLDNEDGAEAFTIWCDRDLNGRIDSLEQDPANKLWNFGGSSDYPTLGCGPIAANPLNNTTNQTDDQEELANESDKTVIQASPAEAKTILDRIQQGTRNSYGSTRDPLIDFQWYLNRTGINRVWAQGHTGSGVHVSLVDIGMELVHEDLIQNVVAGASRNFLVPEGHIYRNNPQNPSAHGTASAGTIAAKGDNGIGIKGMAPDAGIYAYTTGGRSDSEYLASLMPTTPQTAVSANVWGATGDKLAKSPGISSLIEDVLEDQLNTGFYGTGISYTIAAHNGRAAGGSANYMSLRNHRAFINVCAVGPDNKYASYSNPGANLWLCGPSSGDQTVLPVCLDPVEVWRCKIATTDISGEGGWNKEPAYPARGGEIRRQDLGRAHTEFGGGDYYIRERNGSLTYLPPIAGDTSYTQHYGGTSASTPIVSGAIAVLRAAYPHLSWRDVKLILAESAEQLDKDNPFWQVGAAAYHNHSRRYTHSIDYGFGMIDMVAAMKLAAEWQRLPSELRLNSLPQGYEVLAPTTQSTIRVPSRPRRQLDFIEHIDVDIDIHYDGNMRDLDIVLTSPHGTRSILSQRYPCVDSARKECDKGLDWTFGTAAHLGEDPAGEWTLSVNISSWDQDSFSWQPLTRDISNGYIFLGWRLIFYGHRKQDRQDNPTPLPSLPTENLNP